MAGYFEGAPNRSLDSKRRFPPDPAAPYGVVRYFHSGLGEWMNWDRWVYTRPARGAEPAAPVAAEPAKQVARGKKKKALQNTDQGFLF